jgi:hypothetical protein
MGLGDTEKIYLNVQGCNSVTPTYDGNGNLIFDGTFTYGYDAENRLISARELR